MQLFGCFKICISGHCISLPAWTFRGIAKFTELEGCMLAVAQLISMAWYQCKTCENGIMLLICALSSNWSERRETRLYYWNILWKCGVLLLGATGGCHHSEETHFDNTIQNMKDYKKSSSQIVRHKEGVFGG